MLLASAHPEASYPTSSGDNVLSIGTYLHANYKIHISMLSVLYTHLVCMDVAGVFSSEYYILLVACFPAHKQFLHRKDTGKCIFRPFVTYNNYLFLF
jgi:hypothetical protein